MSEIFGPNGVPVVGGPTLIKAKIGQVELQYLEDPRVGVAFDPRTIDANAICQALTSNVTFLNALCREVVSLRQEKGALEERVAKLEAMLNPETAA